jgi:hypothetical protein
MRILVLALFSLLASTGPAWGGELRVTASVFGNVFAEDEPIVFGAGSTAPVAWRLADLEGATVAQGRAVPTGGRTFIYLPAIQPGYYRLQATADQGSDDQGTDGPPKSDQALVVVGDDTGNRRIPADARFDVVTHFALGWKPDILPLLVRAGIAGLRDELPWAAIETAPGRFSVPPALDEYVATAHRLHIEVLAPLTYANPLYDGGETPHSPEGIAAYARYAGAVLRHFGDRLDAVEVWNEYNGAFAAGPVLADRPRFYAALLKATYDAAKAVRGSATVVGGGVAGVPVPYLEALIDRQALANLDAVQIHPYYDTPEDAEFDVAELQRLLAQRSPGRNIPIWATETGSYDPQDRRRTAARLIRLSTVLLAQGVARLYWYLLRDTPDFPAAGLLANTGNAAAPYAPTPAYAGYATLIRMLRGARFHDRSPSDPRTRIYRFDGPQGQVRVAWSTDGATTLRLKRSGEIRTVRLDGRSAPLPEGAAIPLSDEPIFILGPAQAIAENRPDRVIADSAADFGDRQGAGNWSYGGTPAAGFREARWSGNDWGHFWADPQLPSLSIERFAMQPSIDAGQPVAAVRRWRSPYDGNAGITLSIARKSTEGDGVRAAILRDGIRIWSAELGTPGKPRQLDIRLSVLLTRGTQLDFAVTPASGRLDFDNTEIRIRITAPTASGQHG